MRTYLQDKHSDQEPVLMNGKHTSAVINIINKGNQNMSGLGLHGYLKIMLKIFIWIIILFYLSI